MIAQQRCDVGQRIRRAPTRGVTWFPARPPKGRRDSTGCDAKQSRPIAVCAAGQRRRVDHPCHMRRRASSISASRRSWLARNPNSSAGGIVSTPNSLGRHADIPLPEVGEARPGGLNTPGGLKHSTHRLYGRSASDVSFALVTFAGRAERLLVARVVGPAGRSVRRGRQRPQARRIRRRGSSRGSIVLLGVAVLCPVAVFSLPRRRNTVDEAGGDLQSHPRNFTGAGFSSARSTAMQSAMIRRFSPWVRCDNASTGLGQ